MDIVEADEPHIPAILRLWTEFIDYHRDFEPIFTRTEGAEARFEEHLRKSMDREDAIVLVAIEAGQPIAYALAMISRFSPAVNEKMVGYIADLQVTSSYRRKGIGSLMLQRVLDWYDSQGIKRIHLGVVNANDAASSFWQKHGFKPFINTLFMERK